jgi:DNA-binding PadR family transcriptional regulator
MPRITGRTDLPPLSGALLGLLHQQPRSGYDLRRLFVTTPMGHFSDSPGSIYPALRRLAAEGLIAGTVEKAKTLRPRQVFRVTPKGLERLKAWLAEPVTRERAAGRFDLLLLRFVFMPDAIGLEATATFLRDLERELTTYVADLRTFFRTQTGDMRLAGRLGFQAGLEICEAHLRWARTARRALARQRSPRSGGGRK